jgi:hypothetical protein
MQSGTEFLRAQVEQATALHASLLESMVYHESEANDSRYRDLCDRHLPRMREHQLLLEELRVSLGSGTAFPARRVQHALADASISDYQRLAADLDLARRLEVTFKTFRDAGRAMRIDGLARLGETAERHHDDYSADAKRLLLQMFIERADSAVDGARVIATDSRADSRIR